jgi:predicted nucleic acid-binding protein
VAKSAQPPNIVDSSAWLEYFTGGAQAARFAGAIEDSKRLIVPVIVLYEVFKKVLRERGEQQALQVAGAMHAGKVVPVDAALVLDAARYPLPLADSLIYATAKRLGAIVWTQDGDFKGLPGVQYFARPVTKARKK